MNSMVYFFNGNGGNPFFSKKKKTLEKNYCTSTTYQCGRAYITERQIEHAQIDSITRRHEPGWDPRIGRWADAGETSGRSVGRHPPSGRYRIAGWLLQSSGPAFIRRSAAVERRGNR
jgi:hypothetical protein